MHVRTCVCNCVSAYQCKYVGPFVFSLTVVQVIEHKCILKFKAGRLHIFSTLEFKWHLLHSLSVWINTWTNEGSRYICNIHSFHSIIYNTFIISYKMSIIVYHFLHRWSNNVFSHTFFSFFDCNRCPIYLMWWWRKKTIFLSFLDFISFQVFCMLILFVHG